MGTWKQGELGASTWTSQTPVVQQRVGPASQAGLMAVAIPIAELIKTRLRQGYTSGRFVTGNSADHVEISKPHRRGRNKWEVTVGTHLIYDRAWEVGSFSALARHYDRRKRAWVVGTVNPFTRHYERVEIWRPTAFQNRDRSAEEFARVFKQAMETGA